MCLQCISINQTFSLSPWCRFTILCETMYTHFRAGSFWASFCLSSKYATISSQKRWTQGKNYLYFFPNISSLIDIFLLTMLFCLSYIETISKPKKALASLKFYKGYEGKNDNEITAFTVEFERLKAFASEQKVNEKIGLKDLSKFRIQLHF